MNRLDTNGYYALGIPVYAALMLLEARWFRRRGRRRYPLARTIGNLSTSLGAVTLGLFFAPLFFALYDFGLAHLSVITWPPGSPWPWVLGVVASDFCYYWHHRAGHRIGAMWAVHQVHHQSDQFDLSIALRHPWLSDLFAIPFYALMPVLGVGSLEFFVGVSLVSFYAVTIHSLMFARPSLFGLLVTPASHVVHHAKNPRYLGHNYGALFTVWDRLFGTHAEVDPAEPVELGMPRGYQSHDGVKAQWLGWSELWQLARQADSWRDRLLPWWGPPGARPPGAQLPPPAQALDDALIPAATRGYALAQLAAIVSFAAYVLWLRDQHPLPFLVAAAAVVLLTLASLGALLDCRPGAETRERQRLAALALFAAALLVTPLYRLPGALLLGWSALSFAWRLRPSPLEPSC